IAAPPLAARVVALVLEAHGDPVAGERPQALAQRVVELALPLGGEKGDDRLATGDELVAVAPHGVDRVGAGGALRLARVPGVLGGLNLLARGRLVKRRERRTIGHAHKLDSSGPSSSISSTQWMPSAVSAGRASTGSGPPSSSLSTPPKTTVTGSASAAISSRPS